jgi:hypothetical protein
MHRKTAILILIASLAIGALVSAATCIIPRDVTRAYQALNESPTPEARAAYQKAIDRGAFGEHVIVAAVISAGAAAALYGLFGLGRLLHRPD